MPTGTAGVVRGFAAIQWFRDPGIAGRFVDQRGRVVLTGMWPQDAGDRERAAVVNADG
ncbi:hypothetical protein [Arthrobacter psychrolactophilus]|uniref:hypothetical protein n=1 Tax=Arthrobacter psychrolactophilus TaxID=92442 RepID=UPI0015E8E24B|nr:hypothetical protein [Arthrobacter psychrolactophilus]